MGKRYVTHKYKAFGALISGPLEQYLMECDVRSTVSPEDAEWYEPNDERRAKRSKMYLYTDLDIYAKELDTTVSNLIRVGSGIDPLYISAGKEIDSPYASRFESAHTFYLFLMFASRARKRVVYDLILTLNRHRLWIFEGMEDESPYNRISLYYRNMIQLKNRMSSPGEPDIDIGYRGDSVLQTCDIYERLIRGIPVMGNASADYAKLCARYHLSFHWVFAQRPTTSVYGFPDPDDERIYSIFTLMSAGEQKLVVAGLS